MKTVLYLYFSLILSFSVYSILTNEEEPIDLIDEDDKPNLLKLSDKDYF